MATFEMRFGFERSLVRLRTGAFFSPMKEASTRWVLQLRNGYEAIVGPSFEILYRLNDRRFVMVRYECCEPVYANVPMTGNVWTSTNPAHGSFVEDRVAAEWLVRYQFEIPDDLHPALSVPAPKPEPRPLSYWVGLGLPGMETEILAHEVNRVDRGKAVNSYLLKAIHRIGRGSEDVFTFKAREFEYLGLMLFDKFQVKPEAWWGAKDVLPPSHVSLLELPWTPDENNVLAPLRLIFERLHEPLACQAGTMLNLNGGAYPTADEQELGFAALKEALASVQVAAVNLGQALTAFQPPVPLPEPAAETKKTMPKRGTRAANIEKLEKELTDHIRAARSHAIDTKGRNGVPELLPRPQRKELAERCEMSPDAVTRCFQDETADKLNLLWRVADDLEEVMRFGKRRT